MDWILTLDFGLWTRGMEKFVPVRRLLSEFKKVHLAFTFHPHDAFFSSKAAD